MPNLAASDTWIFIPPADIQRYAPLTDFPIPGINTNISATITPNKISGETDSKNLVGTVYVTKATIIASPI